MNRILGPLTVAALLLAPISLVSVSAGPIDLSGLGESGSSRLPPVKWSYYNNPFERDDIGRSNEPDLASWTGVESGCTMFREGDVARGCFTPSFPSPLAPGCTDDTGRQPSGSCGLWTIGAAGAYPPGVLGTSGMSGVESPSPYTGNRWTDEVGFFDLQFHHQAANVAPVELNRKLEDLAVKGTLANVAREASSDVVLGSGVYWAWFGRWLDKNGNGVIDEHPDHASGGGTNEFLWYSRTCPSDSYFGFAADHFASNPGCKRLDGWPMAGVWTWPTAHTGHCGGNVMGVAVTCLLVPADFPGKRLVCAVEDVVAGDGLPTDCTPWRGGDPLLDGPSSESLARYPDMWLRDDASDPDVLRRGWSGDAGYPTWHYDDSVIQDYSTIARVGDWNWWSPGFSRVLATDIDHYRTWAPELHRQLVTTVKPSLASTLSTTEGSAACVEYHCGLGRAAGTGGLNAGGLDRFAVTLIDYRIEAQASALTTAIPSHEPNFPGDGYPGAVRGACGIEWPGTLWTHEGRCNNYRDGYGTGRHAFADLRPKLITAPWLAAPTLGSAGETGSGGLAGAAPLPVGGGIEAPLVAAPRSAGDAVGRVRLASELGLTSGDYGKIGFGPGSQILFRTHAGFWIDRPGRVEETFLDVPALGTFSHAYSTPSDGWIGNLVITTETYEAKGYRNRPDNLDTCESPSGKTRAPSAFCDPFLSGALADPNEYGVASIREWYGSCDATSPHGWGHSRAFVEVKPVGGVWKDPTFVVRDYAASRSTAGLPGMVVDMTGSSATIRMPLTCIDAYAGLLETMDLLTFPSGLASQDVETRLTVEIRSGALAPRETVTDIDRYYATDLTLEV